MAKQSKNQIALQENEHQLEKAKTDLLKAQTTVTKLTQKIPELEKAVDALRVLCGQKPKEQVPIFVHTSEIASYTADEITKLVPLELAVQVPALRDLTGVGSIPAPVKPSNEPEYVVENPDDENAYLPPITGEPV